MREGRSQDSQKGGGGGGGGGNGKKRKKEGGFFLGGGGKRRLSFRAFLRLSLNLLANSMLICELDK